MCKHKIAYHTENIKQQWGATCPHYYFKERGDDIEVIQEKKANQQKTKAICKSCPKEEQIAKAVSGIKRIL